MNKQEVSSFWYTPKGYKGIGLMEFLSIKSFIDNGYKFILYTYNLDDRIFKKLDELLDDFELKDANEIVPFENYFSDDRGAGVAAFSDYFRFNMLYKKGGIWVDLDMVCLNYVDLNQEYIFSQEIDKDEVKPRITTSFLKFPQNCDFGKNLIKEAEKIIDKRKIIPWGIIGPWFLADEVEKYNLEKYALDYKDTCQIPWFKTDAFVLSNGVLDSSKFCLHLFSETWRTNYMKKDARYSKDSIYTLLIKKHKVETLLTQLDYKISFCDKYISKYIFNILHFIKIIKIKLKGL